MPPRKVTAAVTPVTAKREHHMTPALSTHELAKLKSAIDFQVAVLKRDLAQWLEQRPEPRDSTVIRIALLETALDRYLAERAADIADLPPVAADASDMLQAVLRRAVQRRRASLQDSKPRTANPADDEACASRLADALTLLDALPGHVPEHLVSREELKSAGEILSLLVGWFAGGIGGSVPAPAPEGPRPAPDPETPIEPYPVEEWS
jgi:hypothetical protein